MLEDYRAGNGAAPLSLALAAAVLSAVLLPAMMPVMVAAAKKQPTIISNGSLCSVGDASSLAIAQAQPELEGFEMTAGLGSVVVSQQSSGICSHVKTSDLISPNKAGCGRVKQDQRYYCCTTDPRSGPVNLQKCAPTTRDNPCPT